LRPEAGLGEADFADDDLAEAGFADDDLAEAGFADDDLAEAGLADDDLAEAGLADDDFADDDFADDDFAEAGLPEADFADDDLADAGLAEADFADDDFADAGLAAADFAEADLREAALRPDADFAAVVFALLAGFAFDLLALLLLCPLRLVAMTHSLGCPLSGGLSHERCDDGRVVGEPQTASAGVGQLPLLRRQGPQPLHHAQPPREQVIDRPWTGRLGQPEALAQLGERLGTVRRAQVEVAAEDERVVTRPVDGRSRRPHHLGPGPAWIARRRVQVGDAEAAVQSRPLHPPPLRPDRKREPAVVDDTAGVAHQDVVRPALPGRHQIRVEVGEPALQRRQPVA
ncbi:MAG: hypothetical protein QOI45_1383, partial [Thermoleophilaceae bacterium]|nr:hypothetical protein [Thermoleophilaceae bacterium]